MVGAVVILGETPLLGLYSGRNLISLDYLDKFNIVADILRKAKGVLQDYGVNSIKVVVESNLISGVSPESIDGYVIDTVDTLDVSYLATISYEDAGVLKDIKNILVVNEGNGVPAGTLEVFDKFKLISSRVRTNTILFGETSSDTIIAVVDSKGVLGMSALPVGNEARHAYEDVHESFSNAPVCTTSTFIAPNYYPAQFVNIKELLDSQFVAPELKNALFLMDLVTMLPGKNIDTLTSEVQQPQAQVFGNPIPGPSYSANISEEVFNTDGQQQRQGDIPEKRGFLGFLADRKSNRTRR